MRRYPGPLVVTMRCAFTWRTITFAISSTTLGCCSHGRLDAMFYSHAGRQEEAISDAETLDSDYVTESSSAVTSRMKVILGIFRAKRANGMHSVNA